MRPCSGCQRHIRSTEHACPFCGTPLRETSATLRTLVGVLFVGVTTLGNVGCGDGANGASQSGTSQSEATTTTDPTGSETTMVGSETDTGDSTTEEPDPSGSFYAPSSDIVPIAPCDPFFQDCPEGEKCVAYGSSGSNWDANRCVPVLGDGEIGDSCTYDGSFNSTDDCGADSWCWNISADSMGTCTAFCTGSPDDPVCAPGTTCLLSNQGSINVCLELCDPLLQNCGSPNTACYWVYTRNEFLCAATTSDLPPGDSCAYINDCAPGNYCLQAEHLPDCAGDNCCAAFCALDDPEACPEPALECTAFFEQGGPGDHENIGLCTATLP